MFDPFQLPQGWRHSSGQRCKNALSIFVERDFCNTFWGAVRYRSTVMPKPHGPSPCHRILCFVEGIECGGSTGMVQEERRMDGWMDGWMEVDHPARTPTCCLSNALIRFRCEWTWHCDIKEFHSLHVGSSPYCINMPLMFHSDTGLFSCTSPITNGSDKYTDNDMIVNGFHFWLRLIRCGCGDKSKSGHIFYSHLPGSTDTQWKLVNMSGAGQYVIVSDCHTEDT